MNDCLDVKKGDRVWSPDFGWGKIEHVSIVLHVRFEDEAGGGVLFWERNGHRYKNSPAPSLFLDEVNIVPPPRPKRKIKKKMTVYLNLYPSYVYAYSSKEEAEKINSMQNAIEVAVPYNYEWEEEE